MKSSAKLSITSNEAKLFKHLPHLMNLQQGKAAPVMAVIVPTNRCNANCEHCCFGHRDKCLELPLPDLKEALQQLKALGVAGVELAGGGEPTVYPQFDELVDFITGTLGLRLGICTNSLNFHKLQGLNRITWIRLSVNFADEPHGPQIFQRLDTVMDQAQKDTHITACYVVPKDFNPGAIDAVADFSKRHSLPTRIAPNCLYSKPEIEQLLVQVKSYVRETEHCFVSDFNVFLQDRPDNFCAMHFLKPMVFADGWLYVCGSFTLSQENGLNVQDKFRVCRMTEIYQYYRSPLEVFHHTCRYCKYAKQNELLYHLFQDTQFNEFL